jgi:hypothetical protein
MSNRYSQRLVTLEEPGIVERLRESADKAGHSTASEVRAAVRSWLARPHQGLASSLIAEAQEAAREIEARLAEAERGDQIDAEWALQVAEEAARRMEALAQQASAHVIADETQKEALE